MGANFSRLKSWIVGETLTAAQLNAEFDNVLDNLDPTGIDDESASDAAAQATSDPYASSSLVKATSLEEELQQLRYLIAQITGETYWYIDPDNNIATIHAALIEAGTIMLFGQTAAPTGWTKKTDWQDNAMLCYATGTPGSGGSVNPQSAHTHTGPSHTHTGPSHTHTGPSHTHTTPDHTLTEAEMPAHTHTYNLGQHSAAYGPYGANSADLNADTSTVGSGDAHNHGATGAGGTGASGSGGTGASGSGGTGASGANTAPYYQEVIAATKD